MLNGMSLKRVVAGTDGEKLSLTFDEMRGKYFRRLLEKERRRIEGR
jgi:hypothetical protein